MEKWITNIIDSIKNFYDRFNDNECESRDTEFDVEGKNVYAIEFKPNTGETVFYYHEKEDIEQTFICTEEQHNGYVKRLKQKLKATNNGWLASSPSKNGVYIVRFQLNDLHRSELVTIATYNSQGFSHLNSKWCVIKLDSEKDAKIEHLNGNVIAYRELPKI